MRITICFESRWLALILIGALCGCAAYHAEPLEPEKTAAQFERRSLSEPGLCQYLRTNLAAKPPSCPPDELDLGVLTLVGFYYSPTLDLARARVAEADAAIVTAGARPNPSFGAGPEYRESGGASFSPWGIGWFRLNLPIETAGKRGYRIARAERLADAARLSLGETAWAIRSRIRASLLDYMLALRERDLAQREEAEIADIAARVRQRLEAGQVSRSELSLALSGLENAKVKAARAQARVPEAANALAAALGMPLRALDGAKFSWTDLDHPPGRHSLSPQSIQRLALLNRLDLRRELAQYAAADEALKLEIARQYPNLELPGGYSWEGGENIFDLGPSIVLPVLNLNQGPIAEAEARRAEVRAQFIAMQSAIIGESASALTRYRGALAALKAARSAMDLQAKRTAQTARAVAAGEDDVLMLAQARLQGLGAEQNFLDALAATETALGALENSAQRPLGGNDISSFSFPVKSRGAGQEAFQR